MSGLEQSISTIEENESISKDILQNIEQKLGDFYYEDFIDFFDTLSEEGQRDVLEIFNNNFDLQEQNFNPAFRRYIRKEDLPYDEGTLDDLKTKFPVEEQQEKIDTSNGLENRQEVFEGFWNNFSDDPKYKLVFDQYSGESLEDQKKFLNENYAQLLDAAKDFSHTEFVKLHTQLSELKKQGVLELPNFEEYDISLSESILDSESILSPSDEQPIQAALWGSKIQSISWDGKIVKWTWWEVIDNSGVVTQLSLEWKDGMVLQVWEVEKLDTRSQEIDIHRLEQEKSQNEKKINANEKNISGLEKAHSEFQSIPHGNYTDEWFRQQIAKKFASQSPKWEAMNIFRAAESASWEQLKNMVLVFLTNKIVSLSNQNTQLSQRNMEISRNVGVLVLQIQSKQRLAELKTFEKKMRVKKSQVFLESMWVSPIIVALQEVFPMISEWSPVYLDDKNIITWVDFANMRFTWSFTPALWWPESEWDPENLRTQQVISQLMNKALTWESQEPFVVTESGNQSYKIDWELKDKVDYERFVDGIIWVATFDESARGHLFWMDKWAQEIPK